MLTKPTTNFKYKFKQLPKFKLLAFTLVELVLVMVIIAVLSATSLRFIDFPVKAYADTVNRQEIVNAAEVVFSRLSRDIRAALPNSVRVKPGNAKAIEFLNVVRGYRYRSSGPGAVADRLTIGASDNTFNVFGLFPSSMLGSLGYRVAIYNLGAQGANSDAPTAGMNAYSTATAAGPYPVAGSAVITPSSNTVTLSNNASEGRVTLLNNMIFGLGSSRQRVYFIDTPISYICDLTAGTITRYSGYAISSTQPDNPAVAPLSTATKQDIIATGVSGCSFTYDQATAGSSGLVVTELVFTVNGHSEKLYAQTHVSNAP